MKKIVLLFVLFIVIKEFMCGCIESYATICETIEDFEGKNETSVNVIIKSTNLKNPPKMIARSFKLFCNVVSITVVGQLSGITPLTAMPYCQTYTINTINLYDNEIKHLYHGESTGKSFPSMNNIHLLKLRNNKIESIEPETFSSCQADIIDLSYNRIEIIEFHTFTNDWTRNNTKTIYLNNNRLTTVEKGAFPSTLEHLDLTKNELSYLELGFCESLDNLESLILSHNRFATVPKMLSMTKSFSLLDLSHNRLIRVTGDICRNASQLGRLILRKNRISHVENYSFTKCKHLNVLDLSHNKLTTAEFLIKETFGYRAYARINLAFNLLTDRHFIPNKNNNTHTQTHHNSFFLELYGNPWVCTEWFFIEKTLLERNIIHPNCDKKFFGSGRYPFCVCPPEKCSNYPEGNVDYLNWPHESDTERFIEIAQKAAEVHLCPSN